MLKQVQHDERWSWQHPLDVHVNVKHKAESFLASGYRAGSVIRLEKEQSHENPRPRKTGD